MMKLRDKEVCIIMAVVYILFVYYNTVQCYTILLNVQKQKWYGIWQTVLLRRHNEHDGVSSLSWPVMRKMFLLDDIIMELDTLPLQWVLECLIWVFWKKKLVMRLCNNETALYQVYHNEVCIFELRLSNTETTLY